MPSDRLVFERFVVGGGNRLAAAAALQAAESPGRTHNPLLLVGPAGVGKTHLLRAVAHRAGRIDPGLRVRHATVEALADQLSASLAVGTLPQLREALDGCDLVLLDDLQRAAERPRTQEELVRLLDRALARGAQVVLASDRPLDAIDPLLPPLRERLAAGLTVEIAPPDPATRRALAARMAADRGLALQPDALDALARLPLGDGHALGAALDRLAELAAAGTTLDAARIAELGDGTDAAAPAGEDEFATFVSDLATAVAAVVETAPWRRRLADAILRWEAEGVRTRRLEAALDADTAVDVEALLDGFARDVERLRRVGRELAAAPADPLLLRDPDRAAEAEALLAVERPRGAAVATPPAAGEAAVDPAVPLDRWFLDRERLAWGWLPVAELVVEDPR